MGGESLRIYDFEGKKNISGERIREARLKLRRFIPDYEIPVFAHVLGVSALWLLGIE